MRDFARLARLFRPHAKSALAAVLAMVGVALFTTVVAYLFGPLFDQVLSPGQTETVRRELASDPAARGIGKALGATEAVRKTAVIQWLDDGLLRLQAAAGVTEKNRAVALPLILLAAFLLKNLCAFAAEYRFNAVGLAFVRDVRRLVYERLLGQSGDFHAKNPSGDLISRVTGDVDRIQSLFGTDLADLVQSVATLAGLSVLVVSRSPELTLIALVVAPAIVVPVVLIANRLRRISKAGRERMGDLTGVLSETLRGHRVVQAYGAERYEAGRFGEVNDRTFRLLRKGAGVMALSSPLVETASVLAFLVLLGYAGKKIEGGTMTLGAFISFGVGLVMMYQPFKRATRINLALQQALASARRLFEVLDAPVLVVDRPGAVPIAPFEREVRFEGVSFAYPNGPDVLANVDLVVPRGSVTALVGPSGAGKTTLANLLPRFMDVTAGRIAIDGVDVREITLASLRGAMALVTQEVVLFDDTVRRNVAYGREDVPEERIRAALAAANAEEFVDTLPKGLDTRVGEAGGRLSGGQRQRLAIARALLKDPPILILDEPTAGVDVELRRSLWEYVRKLNAQGVTIVLTTHYLEEAQEMCDQIAIVNHGQVIACEPTPKLLKRMNFCTLN